MVLALVVGCTQIDPPEGYVRDPNNQTYDYKAVSARGHAIGVKRRPNTDKSATLLFWTEAIEHQKCDIDGYKLASKNDIKSAGGLPGVLFNFEFGEGQSKLTYLVALYVTPSNIITIEAAGPTADLTDELASIRQSMESLR